MITNQITSNEAEVVLSFTLTQPAQINLISVKKTNSSSNTGIKQLWLRFYADGVSLTNEIKLGQFFSDFIFPTPNFKTTPYTFDKGNKLEFVVKQIGSIRDEITLFVALETKSSSNLESKAGTISIPANDTGTLIIHEGDAFFDIKSFMLNTANKNVNVKLYYKVKDTYNLIKEETLQNIEQIFTYSSPLTTTAAKIEITNNSSEDIILDYAQTLSFA